VTPHFETLDPVQARLLTRMGAAMARDGFYLAGGTAVALHLGHRRSVDLDWFTESAAPLADPLQYAGRLRADFAVTDVATQAGTLHARLEGVRVSWIEYRYPPLRDAEALGDTGAVVASLEDLAAMKLAAVAQRGTKRDFVDVHALATRFRPLPELLEAYRRKYGIADVTHVLYGLSWFDDADEERMPESIGEPGLDWETMKDAFRGWIRALPGV
jgi:hypothetical protein